MANLLTKALKLASLGEVQVGSTNPDDSNYTTLMPNIGDIYYRLPASGTGYRPEIHIRTEAQKIRRLDPNEWQEEDFAPADPDPALATSIKFWSASSGGSELSTYYRAGDTVSAYAKVTYANVSGGVDSGTPRARFKNAWVGTTLTNKDLDTSNNTRTSSAFTIGEAGNNGSDQDQRDSYSYVLFNANGASESGATITGTPSKKIYWRNDKRYGNKSTTQTNAQALDGGSGGLNSTNDYSSIGTVSITLSDGGRPFFAIPSGTTNITSIKVSGNATEQIGSFSTTTGNYTNSEGYVEEYKIWLGNQQGAGSTTFIVS
tara:strand:- start:652 stop:1602 length:951 start_codon:yes stop_codon:yes gene_type:complete